MRDIDDTGRAVIRMYYTFAGTYDIVFGPVFHPGRKVAVRIANDRPGQRILDVGVGTGLSLAFFRPNSRVTGIDISAEMLEKARHRVERKQLRNIAALHVMDAENLDFEDNSFNSVLALYVASVVPNPARFAAEMRRVCIPGGTIVLVNHFTSENWALRFMERRLAYLARHIGFHADFPLDRFLAESRLSVRELRPSNLFGYWRLLRCINEKPASNLIDSYWPSASVKANQARKAEEARKYVLMRQWSDRFAKGLVDEFADAVKKEIVGHLEEGRPVPIVRNGNPMLLENSADKK